jgi:hypothetical protein
MKLSGTGNFLWVKKLESVISGTPSLAIDNNSNIYITASFNGWADLDPGLAVISHTLQSTSGDESYTVKLDAAGNYLWSSQIQLYQTTNGSVLSTAVEVDATGNVFTKGVLWDSTTDFDPGPGIFTQVLSTLLGEIMEQT